MSRLLFPRSIAIVGASATAGALGESLLTNLEHANYAGPIHLVNPKRSEIRGRACLPSIDALPEGVDCAVLAIPRAGVVEAAEACARRQVGALIIYAAGFAESGGNGRADQERLREIACESGMVIEGPNCLGMVNYTAGIPLTFVMTETCAAQPGERVAIVSQSGAMAAVLAVNLQHHGLPISFSISTGNEAASGVEDFVEYLAEEDNTRVIAMIVEQFREPRRYLELTRRLRAAGKFLVLLHPGRGNAARASAATHTGALAGDYAVMRTLVSHAGVAVVDSLEELTDVCQLLLRCRSLPRAGTAILAESGAFKAIALDLCERLGLELPAPAPATAEKLRAALPDFIPTTNPLDVTAHALVDPDLYRRTLPLFLDDPGYGSLVLSIILTDEKTSGLKFPPILDALRALRSEKPVIFAALDEGARYPPHWIDELRNLRVPFFPSPERALRALAVVTHVERGTDQPRQVAFGRETTIEIFPGVTPEYRGKQILAQLGIRIPEGALARDGREACAIASRIGYPVALKAQAPALAHKNVAGGVVLNLQDEERVLDAWERVLSNVGRNRPGLALEGTLVERMAPAGVELIVGARRDPEWGPVLLAGLGGIFAEVLHNFLLMPANLTVDAIEERLGHLQGAALLEESRGSGKADTRAVAVVLSRLAELMESVPAIEEVEINPLVVYPAGKGALALDALIVAREN
jgi:acyl-CoA synthetase (NDP forming)